MAWTEITRGEYQREGLRYASDTTDEEWKVIELHLPPPALRGRTRDVSLRDVLNAIFYIAQTGCQWRLLPKDFPPFTTVQRYFYAWRDGGLWQIINHVLLMDVREAAGREASPTAGVIDSQSVKTTESGGPRGYAAEKMIKGRKRHILTDTIGLPVGMIVHPASVQDRDGAPALLESVSATYPWLRHVFADGGYAGEKLTCAIAGLGNWTIEIVKRSDVAKGSVLLPPPLGGRADVCLAQPQSAPGERCRSKHRKRCYLAIHRERQANVAPPGGPVVRRSGRVMRELKDLSLQSRFELDSKTLSEKLAPHCITSPLERVCSQRRRHIENFFHIRETTARRIQPVRPA